MSPAVPSAEFRNRILHAAETLFFRSGIKAVTMDDIARHLGISKKTLYSEFEDKDKLVSALMESRLKEEEMNIMQIDQAASDMVEWFLMLMNKVQEIFERINPVLFFDLRRYHPDAWRLFNEFKERCIYESVFQSIRRGKKEGLVRPDVDPAIMSRLRLLEVDMVFDPESFPPDQYKMAKVQSALLEHFLFGICTIKGHQLINESKQKAGE